MFFLWDCWSSFMNLSPCPTGPVAVSFLSFQFFNTACCQIYVNTLKSSNWKTNHSSEICPLRKHNTQCVMSLLPPLGDIGQIYVWLHACSIMDGANNQNGRSPQLCNLCWFLHDCSLSSQSPSPSCNGVSQTKHSFLLSYSNHSQALTLPIFIMRTPILPHPIIPTLAHHHLITELRAASSSQQFTQGVMWLSEYLSSMNS